MPSIVVVAIVVVALCVAGLVLVFLALKRVDGAHEPQELHLVGQPTEEAEADPDALSLRAAWDDMIRRIHAPTIRKMSRKKSPKQGLYYTPYGGPRRA